MTLIGGVKIALSSLEALVDILEAFLEDTPEAFSAEDLDRQRRLVTRLEALHVAAENAVADKASGHFV